MSEIRSDSVRSGAKSNGRQLLQDMREQNEIVFQKINAKMVEKQNQIRRTSSKKRNIISYEQEDEDIFDTSVPVVAPNEDLSEVRRPRRLDIETEMQTIAVNNDDQSDSDDQVLNDADSSSEDDDEEIDEDAPTNSMFEPTHEIIDNGLEVQVVNNQNK